MKEFPTSKHTESIFNGCLEGNCRACRVCLCVNRGCVVCVHVYFSVRMCACVCVCVFARANTLGETLKKIAMPHVEGRCRLFGKNDKITRERTCGQVRGGCESVWSGCWVWKECGECGIKPNR